MGVLTLYSSFSFSEVISLFFSVGLILSMHTSFPTLDIQNMCPGLEACSFVRAKSCVVLFLSFPRLQPHRHAFYLVYLSIYSTVPHASNL